jgi:hypothetical protein
MRLHRSLLPIPVVALLVGLAMQTRSSAEFGTAIGDDEARQIVGGQATCPGGTYEPRTVRCGASKVECRVNNIPVVTPCSNAGFSSTVRTGDGTEKLVGSSTATKTCEVCGALTKTQCGGVSVTSGGRLDPACSP